MSDEKKEIKKDKNTLDGRVCALERLVGKLIGWVEEIHGQDLNADGKIGSARIGAMLLSCAMSVLLGVGSIFAVEEIVVRWDAPEGEDAVLELNADERDDAADVGELIMTASGSMKIDVGGTTAATFSSTGISSPGLASTGNLSATQSTSGTVATVTITGAENADAKLILDADDGDDAADKWTLESEATGNDLSILNDTTEVVNVTSAGVVTTAAGITATTGNITATAGNLVGAEATVDGKYAVTGGDATTGLMVQKASITSTAAALQTNSFAVAFGAAPVVTCTYTEDPGDVRPIFVTTVTASNFVASVTADKNFAYIAVGTRP